MQTETTLYAPVQDLIDVLEWRTTTLEGRPFEQATFAEGALDAIQSGIEGLRGMPELVQIYCAVADLATRLHQQGQVHAATQLLPLADALEGWAFEVECPAEDAQTNDAVEQQTPPGFGRFVGVPRDLPAMNQSAPAGALSLLAARCEVAGPSRRRTHATRRARGLR